MALFICRRTYAIAAFKHFGKVEAVIVAANRGGFGDGVATRKQLCRTRQSRMDEIILHTHLRFFFKKLCKIRPFNADKPRNVANRQLVHVVRVYVVADLLGVVVRRAARLKQLGEQGKQL